MVTPSHNRKPAPRPLLSRLETRLRCEPELPSIVDFAEDPAFIGKGGRRLYPRQKTLLRLIYLEEDSLTAYDRRVIDTWMTSFECDGDRMGVPGDVYERMAWLRQRRYRHFREVLFVGGRRAGKTLLGAIMAAYELHRLIALGDPQTFYGIDVSKPIMMLVAATNFQQARSNAFDDIARIVTEGRCFQEHLVASPADQLVLATPADLERAGRLSIHGVERGWEAASLRVRAVSSNSRASRGVASLMQVYDELAHVQIGTAGPQTAEELYRALIPSLDQFHEDGFVFVPTSPYTKVGPAYEIYEAGLARDPDTGGPRYPRVLVIQLPSWAPYEDFDDAEATNSRSFDRPPQVYSEAMAAEEERDPVAFGVERRAQWAAVRDAYLRPEVVDRIFSAFCSVCGQPLAVDAPVCPRCNNQTPPRVSQQTAAGLLVWSYRGHADPSRSQANFAVAIGHTEPFSHPDGSVYHHVVFDHLGLWRPKDYPDSQLPYDEIQFQLAELISSFPTLKTFTYDQYGGFVTVPLMRQELRARRHGARVWEETFTEASNNVRAERFKSAAGLGWVHCPRDRFGASNSSLLEAELKFLQEVNGRVRAQSTGPVRTKDLADCVMVVSSELLADQLTRLPLRERLGETRIAAGAQGGYHSTPKPPRPDGPRDRLQRFGASRGHRWPRT